MIELKNKNARMFTSPIVKNIMKREKRVVHVSRDSNKKHAYALCSIKNLICFNY